MIRLSGFLTMAGLAGCLEADMTLTVSLTDTQEDLGSESPHLFKYF